MELTFRPAHPQDVDQIVPLMHESSRALLDATFGTDRAAAFLRRDFLRGSGTFGYARQMVGVTADGAVVTTCTAYRGDRYLTLSTATVRTALVHFGLFGVIGVLLRTLALSGQFITPRREGVFFANLCTSAEYRGAGIGTRFVEHLLDSARRQGAMLAELDVSFSNPDAQRLYERLGFTVVENRPDRTGQNGFRRMRRPLTPG